MNWATIVSSLQFEAVLGLSCAIGMVCGYSLTQLGIVVNRMSHSVESHRIGQQGPKILDDIKYGLNARRTF